LNGIQKKARRDRQFMLLPDVSVNLKRPEDGHDGGMTLK
jgi:hypothetical protein